MSNTDNASVPATFTAVPAEDQSEHRRYGYNDPPPGYGAPPFQGFQPEAYAQKDVVVIPPGQHAANPNAERADDDCTCSSIIPALYCCCQLAMCFC